VGEKKPGRPTKCTPATASQLVALIARGDTVSAAADSVGITRRSVAAWRARAYSSRPEDAPYVEFEQSLTRALLAATEHDRRFDEPVVLRPIDDVLRDLDDGWP
jgi:hypothetical protein